MFPSFKSLADRERKRVDLLQRVQRRVRQNNVKRRMYAETGWVSDTGKTISLDKKESQDSSSQVEDGDLKKPVASLAQPTDTVPPPKVEEIPVKTEESQEIPEVKSENELVSGTPSPEVKDKPENEAKRALIKIFKIYPVLDKLQLHPLDKNGRQMTKYIIQSGTKIYIASTKRKSNVSTIDWDETYDSIRDVINTDPRFIRYISDLKKAKAMAKSKASPEYRLTEPLEVWESLIGKKRRLSNPLKNDNSNRSKQRLEDSFAVDASTSTEDTPEGKELTPNTYTSSQDDAEARHGVLNGNDEDMDKILSNADNDAKLIITRFYTDLRSKKVKVAFDLQPVIDTANEVKVHQSYYFDNPIKKRLFNIKDLTTGKAISAGDLSDLMKSIRWMDTFTALMDGFQYLDKYLTERGDKTSEEKTAQTNLTQNLEILDRVLQASTKSTEATSRVKEQSTDPYVSLRLLHDEAEAAYKEYGEAVKKYEEARELAKNRHSKAAKSNLKAATAAMRATKANYNAKLKRYSLTKKHHPNMDLSEFDDISSKREVRRTISSMVNKLEGRGLRGAGMKPLDGAKRKTNQTYNLNDIQGMATPSAYVYRKIGSKFIRLPDLDKNTLTIVQPNRRKVGPMREISDELQAMLKDLVFRNSISQDKYDHLSINDKRLFKEILEMTHLQYNFDQHLEDPLESLRMEYDKLKGELMLGNNNPSILKQLKVVCVDMYSNRLISDSEFKSIITRLL